MWKKCCPCIRRTYEPPDVQELDYRHSSLCEVPPEIFTYERTLEKLDLGCNQISDLPPNLFHCHELRDLDLCDNDLKEIPSAIESLNRLAKLDVSRNALSEVPESIKNCKNLTYLDLSLNQLTKLPEAICQLVHLEDLFLNETALEFLPANFGRLTKLKILELRENLLQTLPKSMSRLHQLQRLDIGSNDIEELPEVIGTMTSLTELWADNNCIRDVPKYIGNLTKLACLDLSKNDIREISNEIGKCTNLIDVTLTHNSLSILPDSFTKLENVATVRVDCNSLNRLPEDMGKLKNLQELSAVGNILKSLPLSIGLLRKLHTLYVDDNRLTELPIEIGSCTSLTVLSVAKNNLTEIPSELGHLGKLKMLKLTNNSIQNLPVSILSLTNLGALWLTDAQNKPLVALNREIDPSTGQHVVTCCLLPQLPLLPGMRDGDTKKGEGEEEAPRRSERKIRFQNEIEPPAPEKPATNGGLLRAPTPYPKELRALAKHASHIRQAKSQNGEVITCSDEPMYEGDLNEETGDFTAKESYEMKSLLEKREEMGVMANDNHEERVVNDKVNLENKDPMKIINPLPDHHQEKAKSNNWVPPEINPALNTIGLPEVAYNNTPYVEDVTQPVPPFSIGRTPPPYHIAAKRAAFFRSSGGAGSGKINFPTEPQQPQPTSNNDVMNHNVPIPPISTGQYQLSEDNNWSQGELEIQEQNNLLQNPPSLYQETTPSPVDNMTFSESTTVHYIDREVTNHKMDFEYGGALPDKNANITSAKQQYSHDVTDNVNANTPLLHHDHEQFQDDQILTLQQHIEVGRGMDGPNLNLLAESNEQRVGNVVESRIPMMSQKGNNANANNTPTESRVSRIPSIQGAPKRHFGFTPNAGENAHPKSSVPDTPPPPPPTQTQSLFIMKDNSPNPKTNKTGIPMHFETKHAQMAKSSASTSKIPGKFMPEEKTSSTGAADNYRRSTASVGNMKFASGIPKSNIPSGNTGIPTGIPSPSANHDVRKSSSRIPKFDAPRATPEDVNLPSPTDEGRKTEIPSFSPAHSEKAMNRGISPKPSRSGIPKPPTGRTPSPTGSKIPRKPWIFGTHRNARVVSVEHTKVNQFQLGFIIDDFAGHPTPPEGKGIYVVATDSEELPVKVGDKILQVDGIDVGNMGVEIVNKILGNCQENIQLLVSRQQ